MVNELWDHHHPRSSMPRMRFQLLAVIGVAAVAAPAGQERGRDVRLFVVGGKVIGAIERTAPAGDWRTNVARGGTAQPIDAPLEWRDYALSAARAVGADYAGVDILESRTGEPFVLEVNGIPGWQGLQAATGVDVAAAIVELVESRVASHRELAPEQVHA